MSHTQINSGDWGCIGRMLRTGFSFREIAKTIGKNVSSVSRHVNENGGRDDYDGNEVRRRKRMKRIVAMESIRMIKGNLLRYIKKELKDHKSPEQIAGVIQRKGQSLVASTIYRYLNERAPHLKHFLRSKKGKYRRRRGTKIREKQREQAKKRRIDERPGIVDRRGRIGDYEGDTMMGRDRRVRIVTFVDRRTGYLIAFILPKVNTRLLTSLAIKYFSKIPRKKKRTITFDNGFEFADWESLEKKSGMIVYFAYPYHSWERGTNENTNGLLRQYFPKDMDFNLIKPKELAHVVRKLNRRPRKRLAFLSPREVFWKKRKCCN